jgi:HD domain
MDILVNFLDDVGTEPYKCSVPWDNDIYNPQTSKFFIKKNMDKEFAEIMKGLKNKKTNEFTSKMKNFSFIAKVIPPKNIPVRNFFYTGVGYHPQEIVIVGKGDTFYEAESDAFRVYSNISECQHDWFHYTMGDNKTLVLDGDCTCKKCGVYVKNFQMDQKLYNAMILAYKAHDGQIRKYSGLPYINHPMEVYSRVAWWKILPQKQWFTMAKASWLHDVIEDCPFVSEQDILESTDIETLNLVKELTNPSKNSKEPRHIRKQIDREHYANVSWEAKIIKMFDRIQNLRDMNQCPDKNFLQKYKNESKLLLESLKDADLTISSEFLKLTN